MNREENLRRIKQVLGVRFPVGLKDSDYEGIFERLHRENLVIINSGKLSISEKGRERLKILAEEPVASRFGTRRNFISAKRIQAFSEGL
jgi:hypothetical protein